MLNTEEIKKFKEKMVKKITKIGKEEEIEEGEPDFYGMLTDFDRPKFFEVLEKVEDGGNMGGMKLGRTTYSIDVPIRNIKVEYSWGFSQVTLWFGNHGHIHLEEDEFEKLKEIINWIDKKRKESFIED